MVYESKMKSTTTDMVVDRYVQAVLAKNDTSLAALSEMNSLSGEGGNTGAQVFRLSFMDNSAQRTRSLILKTVDTAKIKFSPAFREKAGERMIMYAYGYTDARMFRVEVQFYVEWKPLFDAKTAAQGSMFPLIVHAEYNGDQSMFSATRMVILGRRQQANGGIVMEDLGPANGGVFFPATSTEVELNVLKLICTTAAKFTGSSISILRTRPAQSSFQYKLTMMDSGILLFLKSFHFRRGITKRVKSLWGSSALRVLNDDSDLSIALEQLEKKYAPKIAPASSRAQFPVLCLVHGDLHAQNFAYFPAQNQVKMFDMQMWGYGSPATEFAYFLSSNLDPNDVDAENALLTIYYDVLIQNSDDDELARRKLSEKYPYKVFVREVRLAQLEFAVATLVRRAYFETPKVVKQAITKQGGVAESMQKVLLDRELRFLAKVKQIWKVNPDFDVGLLS